MALSAHDLRAMHADAPGEAARGGAAHRATPSTPATFKPNAYAGTCTNCGTEVAPGDGLRDRRDGRWVVWHRVCPDLTIAPENFDDAAPSPGVAALREAAMAVGNPAIWDGTYTMLREDDTHRTFEVETVLNGDLEGKVIISFLSGRDNESDYKGFGFVVGTSARPRISIWKRFRDNDLLADDVARFLAFLHDEDVVKVSKKCIACKRKLTNPDSIEAGIGPICAAG